MGGTVGTITFSADGTILAATSDKDHRVQLWNVRDPRAPRPLGAVPDVLINDFALAPDGQTLAVPGAQDDVVLWDASTPEQPTKLGSRLVGNTDAVWTVAFSPDGRTLATGSRDSRILLYDLTDRTHPVPLGTAMTWPGAGGILSVSFAPDAPLLAAAGFDGNLVLWDLGSMNALRDNALANACALAGRGLTAQEWSTYTVGVSYRSTC
jgi:WD40 repeat protein